MNPTCCGMEMRQDYPAFESEWLPSPLRIYVCKRCGKAKSEGQHQKINSDMTGQMHDRHVQMAIESAEKYGV